MISNVDVHLAIAEEALAESERLEKLARRPKPDGELGFIVKYDPERKSFKHSLISIAFAGMFLEACFYIAGVKRFGAAKYNKDYDMRNYVKKLAIFNILDPYLVIEAEHFRSIRNDLLHEKAIEINYLDSDQMHFAQKEAKRAVSFVKQVAASLARESKVGLS